MDSVTMTIGGRPLTLRKSEHLIGVKPRTGADRAALKTALAGTRAVNGGPQLGGFQLVEVADNGAVMERTLNAIRAHPEVSTGTHVFHTSDDNVPFVPTGQLYIEFAAGAPLEQCQELLGRHHLQVVEARGERELVTQVTPESSNPVKVAAALQESPLVAVAEPDLATPGKLQAFIIPSDSLLKDQWHLRNTGAHRGTSIGFRRGADARVVEAWERAETLGSRTVVIAVIDDGFDLTHPDLAGEWKLVAPMDFTRRSADPRPDVYQADWHGTACAGVATGNANGSGIVGAAPNCRLMPVRWGLNLADREIEAWFGYVLEQGAWVVSCSWGAAARNFPLSTRASRAIQRCARDGRSGLGTVICFAAGNENRDIDDPANGSVNGFAIHEDVIAVAASTSRDERSNYSNFGAAISVCAPSSGAGGWGILTSDVTGEFSNDGRMDHAGYAPGDFTDDFGGTSSACPLVAGICALLLSIKPDLTAREVKDVIQSTARQIGAPADYDATGHSKRFGYGCVDAAAAVAAVLDDARPAPLWGDKGHRTTNGIAIQAVPMPLRAFYEIHRELIEDLAIAADHEKQSDPAESPRHFIDIDLYGAPPFSELPEDFEAAIAAFGKDVVYGRGILPWRIAEVFDDLVRAFQEDDADAVLTHSAWLGHYIGDAHVPLHTTANHNGQLTGQKGLHSYFETKLVKQYVSPHELRPAIGRLLDGPILRHAFEWVRESHSHVQAIVEADAATGGRSGRRRIAAFAAIARPIVVGCLERGATRLASAWSTAWHAAGEPELAGLQPTAAQAVAKMMSEITSTVAPVAVRRHRPAPKRKRRVR